MEKLNVLIKLSAKFNQKYLSEYFKLIIRPILIVIIGFLSISITFINPFLAIVALFISIPCVCYGFWRGFLITYSLNIAAFYFIKKNSSVSLEECYKLALKNEKDFALYIVFFAIVSIIGYIPSIIAFIHIFPPSQIPNMLINPVEIIGALASISTVCIINTIVLVPFLNYATQAYLFKKDETFIQLFINCYKKLDLTGFIIAIVITLITFIISSFFPIVYAFTFIIINVFVYSINTFWYYTKIASKSINNS